jgi:hypothetical protein
MPATIKFGNTTLKALSYAFPSRGLQAEDYTITVNGEKLDHTRVRTTKGRDKEYTYFKTKDQLNSNQSYYVEGVIPTGSAVTLTVEEKAPKVEKAAAPTQAKAAPAPTPKVVTRPSAPAKPSAPPPQVKARGKK